MANITLETIAKKAGVSPSAVSRVLRNDRKCFISQVKRDRILEITRQLGYVPNISARNLALGRTSHLAFVLCSFSHIEASGPFVFKVLEGAEKQARREGFALSVITIPFGDRDELEKLYSARPLYDGLVFGNSVLSAEEIALAAGSGMPAVIMEDDPSPRRLLPRVITSKQRGIDKAVAYLKKAGHSRIALYRHRQTPLDRFQRALESNDLEFKEPLDFTFPPRSIYELELEAFYGADTLLRKRKAFSAVLCSNDFVALGLCRRLRQEGIRPGEDLSVMGFDDIEQLLGIPEPEQFLTTIHKPNEEAGRKAVELLIGLLTKGRKAVREAEMPCRVIVRKSVAPGERR